MNEPVSFPVFVVMRNGHIMPPGIHLHRANAAATAAREDGEVIPLVASPPAAPKSTEKSKLPGSFDAMDWVREWLEITKNNSTIYRDEGTMLAWFANAIMAGWDEHARRYPAAAQEQKPVADETAKAILLLADAWANYKKCFEHEGAGAAITGRAWMLVNRAETKARAVAASPIPAYTQADYDRNAIKVPADVKVTAPSIGEPALGEGWDEQQIKRMVEAIMYAVPAIEAAQTVLARHGDIKGVGLMQPALDKCHIAMPDAVSFAAAPVQGETE